MNTRILEILRSYLIGDIDFDTLEDPGLSHLLWEVDHGEDRHLVQSR